VEGYGGRSLGRGLESPRHTALDALEDFLPDEEAVLLGAAAEIDAGSRVSGTVRYQTEFWADGSGMLSERAAADVRVIGPGPLEIEAAADVDVAFLQLGKSHLTLRAQLRPQRAAVEATLRRYRPFFELWTIWGFFSPVAYNEAEVQGRWQPLPTTDVSLLVAARKYEDTHAGAFLLAPKDRSTRGELQSRVQVSRNIAVDGRYNIEYGFGAFTQAFAAGATWNPRDDIRISGHGTAFQQIFEFRTGNAAVLGAGITADARLTSRLRLAGGAALYRQNVDNRPSGADWNQTRAWTSLEFTFGDDPGLRGALR
jgi:hypothetical protein